MLSLFKWILAFVLCLAMGCSPSAKEEASESIPEKEKTVATPATAAQPKANTTPVQSKAENKSGEATPTTSAAANSSAKTEKPAPTFKGLSQLFRAPPMPEVEKVEPPKTAGEAPKIAAPQRPQVRLLGFADVDRLEALLAIDGDVHAVLVGDSVAGVQIVEINPPEVSLQFQKERWVTKLFDQPWTNAGGAIAARSRSPSTRSATNRVFAASPPPSSRASPTSPTPRPSSTALIPGFASVLGLPNSARPSNGQSSPSSPNAGAMSSPSLGGAPGASGLPGGVPGGLPGGAPGGFIGGAPGGLPGGAPGGLPGGAPGGLPGGAPGGLPGGAPGGIPGI